MKRPHGALVAALAALALTGCSVSDAAPTTQPEGQGAELALQQVMQGGETRTTGQEEPAEDDRAVHGERDGEAAARAVVEEFGRRLKDVSLMAPEEIVARSLEESYGGLVVPELLERWKADPSAAPGRLLSSPWPDRIEIVTVLPLAQGETDHALEVQGYVVEKTSADTEDSFTAKRAITLVVTRRGDAWLITDVTLGDYVAPGPVSR